METLQINNALRAVQSASVKLNLLSDETIKLIINQLADLTESRVEEILVANQKDLDRMDNNDPKYDRLQLTLQRIEAICSDLRKVATLPSPLHEILEEKTLPNGIQLQRISVPLGVIGIIYESRPNVTFDVFSLCLKAGNAVVLKGSKDAHFSNTCIVGLIKTVLQAFNLQDIVYLMPSEREYLKYALEATEYIDCIIPRGSQSLINYVRENAKIPIIETGAGIVHAYFDESGDTNKGKAIITNSKARRVSVCNALDCLLIHELRLSDLPDLLSDLGQIHHCIIWADEQSLAYLEGKYPADLLRKATAKSYGIEFLSMQLAVKTVNNLDDALQHIQHYSSKHSETIIAENKNVQETFLRSVDAAVVYANVATSFTDGGEFGLGAEIGISTQKLHARGPMGLREITSYKWVARGKGQIR